MHPTTKLVRTTTLAAFFAFRLLSAQAAPDARYEAIAALTQAKMKEFGVPGVALGVIHNGQTMIRGLGITNVEDSLPVTAHTVFPIASISKTFAATAIMRLVEQGKVDLRAPVRTYLPDFRVRDSVVSRDVTVLHLLTHLAGWEGQVSGPDRGTETLANFVATALPDLMQVAPPGQAWSYNNAGFSIAGRVIESVTGTSINRAMRDLVFTPLGLEHAGTTAGEFIVNRFAAGHSSRDGKATLQRPFSPSVSVTAGGVGLDMTDMMAYARFHMGDGTAPNGERVLKRESLEHMRTPQARKQSTDDEIGIAWHIRTIGNVHTYAHGGTLGGHILLLEIVPERNFAIAILTNSNTGWRLIQDVEREALKSYLGVAYAPNQAIAHRGLVETLPNVTPMVSQPDLAQYVGTYSRPTNSYVVRAESREPRAESRLVVKDSAHTGNRPGTDFYISFFAPDRAVITGDNDKGLGIEFVRDNLNRVGWIRVVGRVAVRTPPYPPPVRADTVVAVAGADAQRVFLSMEVQTQVKLVPGTLMLRYPADLRRSNVEGEVLAQFVVDTSGRVNMRLFRELRSTDARFTDAVRRALADARFIPAEVAGRKVPQLVQQPFYFSLAP